MKCKLWRFDRCKYVHKDHDRLGVRHDYLERYGDVEVVPVPAPAAAAR